MTSSPNPAKSASRRRLAPRTVSRCHCTRSSTCSGAEGGGQAGAGVSAYRVAGRSRGGGHMARERVPGLRGSGVALLAA